MGMTGWVNPFFMAVRRPGTLSVARRRSAGAFFVGIPALVRPPFWLIMQRTSLGLDFPLIHNAQSQDSPQNNVNKIKALKFTMHLVESGTDYGTAHRNRILCSRGVGRHAEPERG
jgi:hypothetical protein